MKKHFILLSAILGLFVINGRSQVSNDSCFKALYVPVGVACVYDTTDNAGATAEDTSVAQNPSCGFYNGGDVWFKTVMPASGNIRFEVGGISGSLPQFAVFHGTCGNMTELKCNQLDAFRTLSDTNKIGDTLYLRIYRYANAGYVNFRFCIWEPPTPAYNNYADAVYIPYDTSCSPDTFNNLYCTNESGLAPNPTCGFYRGGDVWFKTIMPPSGALRIEVSKINGGIPQFAAYSGSPGTFSQIECAQLDGDRTFIDSSLIGDTISIRIFPYSSREGGEFTICAWESPFPSNNNCRDALFLPYSDTCNPITYTNKYATAQSTLVAPNPSCGFYRGGDIWFKTVMPPNGSLRIEVSTNTMETALYSGECGNMTELLCNQLDADKTFLDSSLIGDTLLLRAYSYSSEEGMDFDLCLYEATIMLNDNCADAMLISADTTIGVTSCDTFTNKYATSQGTGVVPNPTCGFYRGGDVWFKVVVPSTGYLNVSTNTSTKQFALYKGSCGNLTQIYCRTLDPNGRIGDPSLAGDTIYIRVFSYSSEEGGDFFMTIYAPRPPANDNCSNALPLSAGNTIYSNAFATADTVGTAPNPSCGFYGGGDIWFTYQVPTSGYVKIYKQGLNAGILPMMQLYSGSCGNMTRIQCAQFGGTIEFTDTSYSGQTLYLRVYNYSSDEGGSFGLCAYDSVCKTITRYYKDHLVCPCEKVALANNALLATSLDRYTVSYKTSNGSDSVLVYLLKESPLYTIHVFDTACYGSYYFYPDSAFSQPLYGSQMHTSNLSSQFGCDSTVIFHIEPWPVYSDSSYTGVCEGDDFIFLDGDTAFNVTYNIRHKNVFTNAIGCDSLFIQYLQVLPIQSFAMQDSICQGSSYVFPDGDSVSNIMVNLVDTSVLQSSYSCDSLVIVELKVMPVFNQSENDTVCFDDSYTFPDGITIDNIQIALQYISNLSTARSCDSIITTNIAVITIDTSINTNGTTLSANDSTADKYQWLDCDHNYSIVGGETLLVLQPKLYNGRFALALEKNGCRDTSGCHFQLGTGIFQQLSNSNLNIYPNPANDRLYFEGYDNATADVVIVNVTGAVVLEKHEISLVKYLDISSLKKGIYLLKITGREDKLTIKFVKE